MRQAGRANKLRVEQLELKLKDPLRADILSTYSRVSGSRGHPLSFSAVTKPFALTILER